MAIYNKLVRNGVPEIIRERGQTPVWHVLKDDNGFLRALLDKDVEEGLELRDNPCLEELADKMEVLLAIGRFLGYSPADIEQARAQKANQRGGFDHRIYLESVD